MILAWQGRVRIDSEFMIFYNFKALNAFNFVAHLDTEILPIEIDQLLRLRSNPLNGLVLLPLRVKWKIQIALPPIVEIQDPLAFPDQMQSKSYELDIRDVIL